MKRILLVILILSLVQLSAFAQTTKKARTKKKVVVPEKPIETPLPPRSADCFFPVKLALDTTFGPTEPLQGFGFVNEIHRDAQTKNVFEQEHNTVWYQIDIPYKGKLLIDIKPKGESDDYDFLVYKYTDKYFCNRVEKNRVKPIRSIMSALNTNNKGTTGLSLKGTAANLTKSSTEAYGRYIDVLPGESYVIVVDNLTDGGLGHSIRAEVYTDHAPLYIQPVDSINKQRTTANIYIKEVETGREVLNAVDAGNTKVKLLPNNSYDITITKSGYFNYFRHTTYQDAATSKDSILTARLVEIKVGSDIPMKGDLYFDQNDQGSIVLMQESYNVLDDVIKTLTDYPQIKIEVIGRISTEGMNLRSDNQITKKRAEAIKDYLVSKGIPESNISTRGSSIKELEKQIAEQNKTRGKVLFPPCEIKIKSAR